MIDHRKLLSDKLVEPRDVLDLLTEAESEQLLALLHRAETTQRRSLDLAIDEAMKALPRLLRIPAKAILFGK